ncbi:MAG: hypothetical protein OXH01_06380, partial [Bacteroidetes bacterium]|nr:hypothetical protein [Bacteroidota bacterium]
TRTMDHTNTRPQGLTIQGHAPSLFMGADPADPTISLRDSNFLPIEEALVDSFYYVVDDDNAPFEDEGDDEGKCREDDADASTTEDGPVLGGCSLDGEITEEGGNFDWPLGTEISSEVGDVMVYFWTGEEGDFNLNESEHQSYAISVTKAAAALKVTSTHGGENLIVGPDRNLGTDDDLNDEYEVEYAEYGETATITIQLVDKANANGTVADDAKPVAESGVEVEVRVQKDDGQGNTEDSTSIHETDESGQIELSFTKEDPTDKDGDMGTAVVIVTYTSDDNGTTTLGGYDRSSNLIASIKTIRWSDADAKATTIKLSSTRDYVKLPVDPGKTARVTISSRVYDQYGDPIKQAVTLVSSEVEATKLPKGARSLGFHVTYTVPTENDSGAAEAFGAWFGTPNDSSFVGTDVTEAVAPVIVEADSRTDNGKTVYWAVKEDNLRTETGIVHIDEDENTIVVSSDTQTAYAVYDSNDQFLIGDTPVLLDKFQEELDQGRKITWTIRDEVSTFTLTAN